QAALRGAGWDVQQCIEAAVARIVSEAGNTDAALRGRIDLDGVRIPIEGDDDVAGRTGIEAARHRLGQAALDLRDRDFAAGARDGDFAGAAGVEADQSVRPNRFDHGSDRHSTGGAEVGRAEDGDVGDEAGVLDEV